MASKSVTLPHFVTIPVSPQDVLDAASTLEQKNGHGCSLLRPNWIASTTYLDWARLDLAQGDAHGLTNALSNSKRAVCARIDLLIVNNHLLSESIRSYPDKIQALTAIGIEIPEIVHELIIEPRNVAEHTYELPEEKRSSHAVQIASLLLGATEIEADTSANIAINWNVLCGFMLSPEHGATAWINSFADHPMLFIDVVQNPSIAKIVDPANSELRIAELRKFSYEEAITLAKMLRRVGHSAGQSKNLIAQLKEQGGF